jgi:hypothetical protein
MCGEAGRRNEIKFPARTKTFQLQSRRKLSDNKRNLNANFVVLKQFVSNFLSFHSKLSTVFLSVFCLLTFRQRKCTKEVVERLGEVYGQVPDCDRRHKLIKSAAKNDQHYVNIIRSILSDFSLYLCVFSPSFANCVSLRYY